MLHKVQWPPAQPRDHNACLARFKVCEQLRASPPTTTAAAAASFKESPAKTPCFPYPASFEETAKAPGFPCPASFKAPPVTKAPCLNIPTSFRSSPSPSAPPALASLEENCSEASSTARGASSSETSSVGSSSSSSSSSSPSPSSSSCPQSAAEWPRPHELVTTGRSQSKPGYSRMWEDPLGDRHAIPLYNRLHFSTVPRKTVTKKTWYLVHNTYASLQNSNGQQHTHHPHHHATHTLANGARMEEVGGDEFRSHNHAERLMRKMETCASKRQLCDVVLIAGNKRIPAHRLVLSAASDYFAAMFMNNVREATMEEVELKDVDPDALASLVQYTYTGRIELKEETVECLLSTACLLQLSEVVEACCSFLMKQLHPSNCIGIRQFADAQGCTDLYKVANNYVMEMFVEVIHNAEFLMLPCDEVCQLLASDDLNVPNEETIFEALVKWAKHDLTMRRSYLPKLLAHIKLPLMAPQYIADHVETNCLFREERECQQLIMEALKYHLLPERRSSFQSPRTKPRKSTVGVLYAVGGMDCTKGATSIEKYELRTNTWTQVANMSGRRLQFGVAVLEDRLYVVGGRDGLKTLNTVECYDPKKKTWTLMPPMSTHRHGLGVGVLEGPMYAVGGHDGWSYLNTVERWDPQARQWSYVAPMSTARSTVGVASLHGKLYAVGGRDGSSCLKSVECFDPHTNKWTHCTPMVKRRGGVGVATCNGFLYAVGGHEAPATNPTCSRYDSAERYDPKTDQWTNISPISSPRDAVGLCPLGDKLFAVGGYDGQQYLNDVECYDPITNEWVKVSSLCTGRAGACVVHVPNS